MISRRERANPALRLVMRLNSKYNVIKALVIQTLRAKYSLCNTVTAHTGGETSELADESAVENYLQKGGALNNI